MVKFDFVRLLVIGGIGAVGFFTVLYMISSIRKAVGGQTVRQAHAKKCGWAGRGAKRCGPGMGVLFVGAMVFAVIGSVRAWRSYQWSDRSGHHFVEGHEGHRHHSKWAWSEVLPGEEVLAEPVSIRRRESQSSDRDRRRSDRRTSRVVLNDEKTTPDPLMWETVDHWPASVYAAAGDAWEGLGRQVVEHLNSICGDEEKEVELSVVQGRGSGNPQRMTQIVTGTERDRSGPLVKLLRRAGWTVRSKRDGAKASANAERCAVQVTVSQLKDNMHQLKAELRNMHSGLREEAAVRFVEKPWVRKKTFVKTARGGRVHWVIGRSGLEAEAKAAARAARDDAHREVAAMLDKAVRDMGRLSPVERIDLTERIEETATRLVRDNLTDEFEQAVSGEFVDTNRCAVLVELDGSTLGTAATKLIRRQHVAKEGLLHRAGAMGVMGVLMWLAYLFVNSGTRGHFVWTLRAGSAVSFVAICLAIHYLQPF